MSLRERYQYTYHAEKHVTRYYANRTKVEKNGTRNKDKIIGGFNRQMLRSRVEVGWSRNRSPWEPFVSVEVFNDVKYNFAQDQIRFSIGTDYKLNDHNVIGLSYRYKRAEDADSDDEEVGQLVKASYTFKF